MKRFRLLFGILFIPYLLSSQVDVGISKTLQSFPPFIYGDQILFQIEVHNYGSVPVYNISIRDIIPCGLEYFNGWAGWTPSGSDRVGIIPGPINPGQSVTVTIDFLLRACTQPDAWLNNVEVVSFTDNLGNDISSLDINQGNNNENELVPVFDLALRKKQATNPPYSYGDLMYFEITVFNQGNLPVQNISVNDYIALTSGFSYDPLANPGWVGTLPSLNRILPAVLLPGDSIKTGIYLTINRTNGGDRVWVNFAEIDGAQDINGLPVFDADSTPSSNSIPENNVLPGSPNDDNILGGGPLAGEDEDDHDPAGVSIFDLAITKDQASALSSFSYVQVVDYIITVYNQGNIPATGILITDYFGEAITYVNSPKNIGRGWVYNPVTHTASTIYTKTLLPGQFDTIMLDVIPIQFYTKHDSAWTNWAEITSARNALTNTITSDIDSTPDNINGNDAGGKPDSPSDDAINGDASGNPGDAVAATDEDDHDPHKIQIFDLALRKSKVTPGTHFSPGADVLFAITIFNQGNVPAKDIVISDYVRDGYQFIPGGVNVGWTGAAPLVKMTIPQTLFPGKDTTVYITLRVQISATPGAYLNYAELSAARDTMNNNRNDDADSIADDNPNNDNQVLPGSPDDGNIFGNSFIGEDEDDHDVAGIQLLCQTPTLTVGIPVCDPGNSTYSVTFYSNVANITSSLGSISGNIISGIPLGSNVLVTATNGLNCTQSLTVQSPDNCPGTGGCDYPKLTVGQPVCTGSGFWAVSFSRDIGIIGSTAGTVSGNSIVNIPTGTNIIVSSSNGFCISRVNVSSPTNCDIPCANSPVSISGPVCDPGGVGTYRVNFIINPGSTLTTSVGTLNLAAGTVTGIPSGTSVTLTITTPGCDTRVVTVPAGDCVLCQKPTLTVGIPVCDPGNSTYSVTFYSNVANITSSLGSISGNIISGIPLGSNVLVTATNGLNCTQSLTVQSPDNCPGTGGCDYPELTVGQPVCTGSGFWAVSFSRDVGIIGTTAGTVSGNSIVNIPTGTNIIVSSSNGFCISRVNVSSPTNCDIPCANSPVSISGPVCDPGGVGTYRVNFIINPGSTLTTSVGTLNLAAGTVTGIPSGTSVTLTITTPGCDTRVVTVPAGDCVLCQKPTLTVGIPVCDPGNSTYSVTYYSNVANVISSAGSISASMVTGIPIGSNVIITAQNVPGCTQSLTVQSPDNCPGIGGCVFPQLTVGQPACTGTGFWSVSFSSNAGSISSNFGTVSGNTIINIPIGNNIVVTSTEGNCTTRVNVNSPVNCTIPCANSPISISGPVCESGGTYRINFIVNPGTSVSASSGTLNLANGTVTGIASGTSVTLTVTTPGCDTRVIVVPAGNCQIGNATIGNFVWHDQNGDGQQSGGEPGLANVVVMLMDPMGNMIAQTTTNSSGTYGFANVPSGSYYLKFSIPSGFQPTFALIGNPNTDSNVTGVFGAGTTGLFTLVPGQINNSLDAGFFRCATIGEYVWYDTNRNDIRDNPENGINGLKVNLWRNHFGTWTIWDYTITGHKPGSTSDDGWWQFCAPPGQYYVQIIIPPLGLVQVQPNRGNNPNRDSDLTNAFGPGTTNSFSVTSGASKLDLAGGYYPMAIAGNLVWRDDNMNGVQDPSESKISGVKVEAFDADNHQKLGESVTDLNGVYEIDYLPQKGVYYKFEVPNGFSPTIPNVGDDVENSDVDHSYGVNTTRKISMESGVLNKNIDLGIAFGVLPVRWLDIYGIKDGNTHEIHWVTGAEFNSDHFVVEQQIPGSIEFEAVSQLIKSKGYSNSDIRYSFNVIDNKEAGTYYYRIRQVDFNGKVEYSKTISIDEVRDMNIRLFPNPAHRSVNLEILLNENQEIQAEIINAQGIIIRTILTDAELHSGNNSFPIDLTSVVNGAYIVRIKVGNTIIHKPLIVMD